MQLFSMALFLYIATFYIKINRITFMLFSCFCLTLVTLTLELPDVLEYEKIFIAIPSLSLDIFYGGNDLFNNVYGEYSFKVLISMFKSLGLDYDFFRFIVIFATLFSRFFFFSYFIRNNAIYYLTALAYVFLFFHVDAYILRQSLGSIFLVFAILSLCQNQLKRFVILVLVASTFHMSCLLFLIIIPFKNVEFTFKWGLASIIVLFPLSFINMIDVLVMITKYLPFEYLSGKIITYSESIYAVSYSVLRGTVLLFCIFFLMALFFKDKVDYKKSKDMNIHILLSFISLFFLIGLNSFGILSERGFRLFAISFPLILVNLLSFLNKDNMSIMYVFLLATIVFCGVILNIIQYGM